MNRLGITWRLVVGTAVLAPALALAQAPAGARGGDDGGPGGERNRPPGPPIIAALDTDHDGELSSEEIKNAAVALKSLDHNHDGALDRSELGPRGGGPGGGAPDLPPGGQGFDGPPPGEDGPPGAGRPPGPGAGRDRPGLGNVLPPFVRDGLSLSAKQQKQIAELEKTVKGKLESILTARQIRQVRVLFERGPGGPGGRGPGGPRGGGPGGPRGGGPGGPPGGDDGEGPPTRPQRPDNE